MVRVKNTDISMTRGDSAYITLVITDETGAKVNLTENDTVHCQVRVKPNSGKLVVNGTATKQGEDYLWHITPEQTRNLYVDTYYWDAQVEFSNGDIFTFIPVSRFTLLDEVTKNVEGGYIYE